MAVFNPQVQPTPDRDYTGVTKPISQPIADTSGQYSASALALNDINKLGTEVVAAADTDIKDIIGKDVRNTIEPIREDFTNQLLAVRQQQQGLVPAPVQTGSGSTATDVLPAGNSSVQPPKAVETGIQKIASIQNFMDSGKANDTYYDMRLKQAVTDLRAKYPGYVDYIDSKVSSITGVNPANAMVQNLMQDINRLQTNRKTEYDKAIDDAMKSGYENSNLMIKKLQSNPTPETLSEFREWYANETTHDGIIKRATAARAAWNGIKADNVETRKTDFNNELASMMNTDFDKLTTIPGVKTPGKILEVMADAVANPNAHTDAEMRAYGNMIAVMGAQFEAKARARANEIAKDNQGRSYSYAGDIGHAEVDGAIASQKKMYDNIAKALTEGGVNGVGVAFAQAQHAQSIINGAKDSLLTNKDIGVFAQDWAASNELFGPNWTNTAFMTGLKQEVDKKMAAYTESRMMQARLNRDSSGNPVTMAQHLEEAKTLEQQGRITAAMRARYTGNLVNIIDDLKAPNATTNAKENVIKYLFSPEGQGILSKIKTDYTDPVTGKFVPGKYAVFNRFTDQDVVDEVKKLPTASQQMYKNYLEREAGAELFQKEFLNLNHFTGHDNLEFKYNDGGNGGVPHIELIDSKGALASPVGKSVKPGMINENVPPPSNYIFQVQKVVDRVNTALAGMSRVEKAFGGNPNEYVLDFLVNKARVDMGKNWEGLPAKLVDSIAASRAPARRIEDTFKNLGNN